MKPAWIYILVIFFAQAIVSGLDLLGGCTTMDCNFLTKYLILNPSDPSSYLGIITMHVLHGGWQHLMGNMSSLLFLSILLSMNFTKVNYKRLYPVFAIFIGLFVILFSSKPVIGASGIVYALYGYTITRGYLSDKKMLVLIASFMFFIKGSALFAGMVPSGNVFSRISWEGHLGGAIIGVIMGAIESDYIKNEAKKFLTKTYKRFE